MQFKKNKLKLKPKPLNYSENSAAFRSIYPLKRHTPAALRAFSACQTVTCCSLKSFPGTKNPRGPRLLAAVPGLGPKPRTVRTDPRSATPGCPVREVIFPAPRVPRYFRTPPGWHNFGERPMNNHCWLMRSAAATDGVDARPWAGPAPPPARTLPAPQGRGDSEVNTSAFSRDSRTWLSSSSRRAAFFPCAPGYRRNRDAGWPAGKLQDGTGGKSPITTRLRRCCGGTDLGFLPPVTGLPAWQVVQSLFLFHGQVHQKLNTRVCLFFFLLTLNKYVQNMNNVRYKTARLLKKTSMYRSRYVYNRHYLPRAVCLTDPHSWCQLLSHSTVLSLPAFSSQILNLWKQR